MTGSTDGIGRETARALAAAGVRVIVHGRSKLKVDATVSELAAALPGAQLDGAAFDLGSLAAVRRGGQALQGKVDVLVNNAGVLRERARRHRRRHRADARGEPRRAVRARGAAAAAAHDQRRVDRAHARRRRRSRARARLHGLRRVRGQQARQRDARAVARRSRTRGVQPAPRRDRDQAAPPGLRAQCGGDSLAAGAHDAACGFAIAEAIADPPGSYFVDGVATPAGVGRAISAQRDALWEATARRLAGL